MRLFPGALQKYWWRPANKWKPRTSSWRLHSEFRTASQARTVPVALSAEPARPCRVHAPRLCGANRSEEHTSELQSRLHLVCRLLLEKKKKHTAHTTPLARTTS